MSGRVKFYSRKKGYGFISGDDGRDYFLSYQDIPDSLSGIGEGYTVQFTPCLGNRGYFASDLTLM